MAPKSKSSQNPPSHSFGSMGTAGAPGNVGSMSADPMAQLTPLVYLHRGSAVVVTDANGLIIAINQGFTDITGYQADEVVGRSMSMFRSGRHGASFYSAQWQSLTSSGHWEGEIWSHRKGGDEFVERLTINTTYHEDGSVRFRVGTFVDITDIKRRDERIWHQAHHDRLTGLPNRLLLQQGLEAKMLYCAHSKESFALLYLDFDHFKTINETLGHLRGDELLRQIAQRLQGGARRSDMVARLGGDKFCVVYDGVSRPVEARALCEQLICALAEPYVLGEDPCQVSASIGVSLYPRHGESVDELMHNAGLAMYAAKSQGRNGYRVFTSGLLKQASVRSRSQHDLSAALEAGQLVLHYQPIIDLASSRVVKAEALLRWQHPQNGLLSPAHFLREAEETGLIVDIGNWVFQEAAQQAAKWRWRYGPGFKVSVNMSLKQFESPNVQPADMLFVQQKLGLPGDSMVVEITERSLMDINPEIGNKLRAFSEAGIQIALDDFGTGSSALPYLLAYRIGYIKIDMSFVRNLEHNANDRRLCEAIIHMAHALGLAVIAEGVSTAGQREVLAQAGCEFAQGFLYSEAVSAQDFEEQFAPAGY